MNCLKIIVAADASKGGIGATISHQFPDKSERVIEHASCTFSAAQQNYSQIEKEALGLVFAVQKFHSMLYGSATTIEQDDDTASDKVMRTKFQRGTTARGHCIGIKRAVVPLADPFPAKVMPDQDSDSTICWRHTKAVGRTKGRSISDSNTDTRNRLTDGFTATRYVFSLATIAEDSN
ncbi:hypothetical protein niasHT_026849 [Heterodera trifolii]|uniref:Reverse transcriptase RNase H-like domain-containing protein n=1 Tax=Heterodera trifolii TaxID=157864 RepID=A0ABD2K4K1_9BILA